MKPAVIIAIVVLAALIIGGIWYVEKQVKANAASNTANTGVLGALSKLLGTTPATQANKTMPAQPTPQQQQYLQPGQAGYNPNLLQTQGGNQLAAATQNAALYTAAGGFLSTLTDNIFNSGDDSTTVDDGAISDISSVNEIDTSGPDPFAGTSEDLYMPV